LIVELPTCSVSYTRLNRNPADWAANLRKRETMQPPIQAKIEFLVSIGIRGPIAPGDYNVGNATVNVSYPDHFNLGTFGRIPFPTASTFFRVSWLDRDGQQKRRQNDLTHNLIHIALNSISELLTAFKLVHVGRLDGLHVRTVGIADTLMYAGYIDGVQTNDLNVAMLALRAYKTSESTELARPHIASDTYPIARRYVRCFELIELGFYKEAIIVAHAILDDITQELIHRLLHQRGLDTEQSRNMLVRAIKEDRFSIYLGPLLKAISGISIAEIWPDAPKAIKFLNVERNKIAHAGAASDRDGACKAIFISMKTVAALHSRNLVDAKFPPGMRRHSRILASWTLNPPNWVPAAAGIETDEFD
jgi:hypothetical protein